VINRFVKSVLAAMIGLTTATAVAQIQDNEPDVLYIARQDINLDGVVNELDNYRLYGVSPIGSINLSMSDAAVMNFSVSPDGASIAYIGTTGDGNQVLDIISSIGTLPLRAPISGIMATRVVVFNDYTWLIGVDAQGIPVLQGYFTATAAPVGEHRFRRPATPVEIDPTGRYALAYNLESGGITVLRLPTFQLVDFALEGFMVEPPVWSPTGSQFVLGIVAAPDAASIDVTLVDLDASATRILYAVPDRSEIGLEWSRMGHYLVATEATRQTIIQTDQPRAVSFQEADTLVNIAGWSFDDTFALSTLQNAAGELEVRLIDAVSGTGAILPGLSALTVSSMQWSNIENFLVVSGQDRASGAFQLVLYDPIADTMRILYAGTDPSIVTSTIIWSRDGSRILFTAASSEALFTSLGAPLGLYEIDLADNANLRRVSSEGTAVDPLIVRYR